MRLILDHTNQEVSDVRSFFFRPEQRLTWKAGQFLHYTLVHKQPDDRGIERYFTISSAPHEGFARLTTRFSGAKGSSFKRALQELRPGDAIEANSVEGDFTVDDPNAEFVFIAGGIGITPYRSILMDLDHRGLPISVKLLYANRSEDVVFKSELERLAATHPTCSIEYFIGDNRIDADAIRRAVPDLTKPIFFISGPEPMVEAFEKLLADMRIPDSHIRRDFFPGYNWP